MAGCACASEASGSDGEKGPAMQRHGRVLRWLMHATHDAGGPAQDNKTLDARATWTTMHRCRTTRPAPLDDGAWARALPKVLLHDHLDGGLRPATLLELLRAARPGGAGRRCRRAGGLVRCARARRRLVEYLRGFALTVAAMATPPALERVAFEAAEDARADGCVLAEFRIAPTLFEAARRRRRARDRGDAARPAAQRTAQRPDPVRDARAQQGRGRARGGAGARYVGHGVVALRPGRRRARTSAGRACPCACASRATAACR